MIAYLFDSRQASLTKVAKNSEEILVKCHKDENEAWLSKESPILKLTLCYYASNAPASLSSLTEEQKSKIEKNRLKALALRKARQAAKPYHCPKAKVCTYVIISQLYSKVQV